MQARVLFLAACLGLLTLGRAGIGPPRVQVPGFAEIVQPAEGETLHGIVTIRGTATHPTFETYELAFGLDPDPTETWFPLGEAVDTRVVDGRLAIWDTGPISDGNYRLRLSVQVAGGEPLIAIVGGLQVRNYTPTEAPAGVAGLPPTPEPQPTELAQAPVVDRAAVESPEPFRAALTAGVLAGVCLPAMLALYASVAPRARAHSGFLRMRRLHQRTGRPPRR